MATKYQWDKNKHSVYALHYHLIICVKYRQTVFLNPFVVDRLQQKTKELADMFDVKITSQECDIDHIHILFSAKPQSDLIKFVNSLKGVTSRMLRKEFPKLKLKLWGDSFWSESYCLITTGQVTLDQLKKYVETQGKPKCN